MVKSEFYNIVHTEEVRIAISEKSHFSIGTSPYYAHQQGLAIDIYQELSIDNFEVLSPISGRVIKTKELAAPPPKFFGGINKEYLILIESSENPEIIFKILHIKPFVQVDQKVEIGDIIGETIRNGYFAYWSSPHIHLEIRACEDAIRARGGKFFSLAVKKADMKAFDKKENVFQQIPVEIYNMYPEFMLVRFPDVLYYQIEPFIGVKGRIDDSYCILDGGIPLYKKGIAHLTSCNSKYSTEEVYLNGIKIGKVCDYRGLFGFFQFTDIALFINNIQIRGVSLFLSKKLPLIKIISFKKNQFPFQVKTKQYLSILT